MRGFKQLSEDAGVALQKAFEDKAGITSLKAQIKELGETVQMYAQTIDNDVKEYNKIVEQLKEEKRANANYAGRIQRARQALNN